MSERLGFRSVRIRRELLGDGPEDWRSYVEIIAPSIALLEDIISLGNRYVVSVGAHDEHLTLLMDKCAPEPLTVERCLNCCALVSYASDSPVVPIPRVRDLDAHDAIEFSRTLDRTVFRNLAEYGEKLRDIAEAAEAYNQSGFAHPHAVSRILGRQRPRWGYWLHYPWPPTEQIFRGISAYWLGLLSGMAPARILNFWRSVEAVTTKAGRRVIFSNLHLHHIAPVWSEATRIPIPEHNTRKLDATRLLRRVALQRRDELIQKFGSSDKVLNFIYWETRGKAAHADRRSLEYDMASFIGDQLQDAELLRYMARVAIECSWRNCG